MKKWIDLGNPTPKESITPYTPINWKGEPVYSLSKYLSIYDSSDYVKVIFDRHSSRIFGGINLQDLANILYLTNIVKASSKSEYGFSLSKRPVPSAGAIHPIHILIASPLYRDMLIFDPFSFTLNSIKTNINVDIIRNDINSVLDIQNGTLILLGAEYGKTASKYNNPDSLIWRDAGILIGALHMAASFLKLSFCPLGITGEPWVSRLSNQFDLFGVGVAVVGSSFSR
ncbi:TPA: nitroreductase [Pasteurella multocida]|uniref:nitroreductase n=1 Tax=Pasteurella multocida TaxID=747 RepID=UPI002B135668|nr:nitroreductase [Pasteurella multocida]HDR1432933.1 nitroreductase [Pasteurella multocida]HDR1791950.1 nitroreductase [Pasteurella multocida]HDR1830064.1 nitroreductase [Pasteurella multocida]HDR1857132.1 nitroreductase [Pasteurella multocida]